MVLARECRCAEAIEFEAGFCFRCGRLLDPVADHGGELDAWIMLEAAIERARFELQDEAWSEGVDVEDPDQYREWLLTQGEPCMALA
jgi:hypothetical protein